MMRSSQIVIGGGSIAGCASAILLSQLGIPIKIYERSTHLHERGAGIVLPLPLLKQCIDSQLFDANIPYILNTHRTFWVKESDHSHRIWEQPIQLAALNWHTIYENLRRRIPDHCYQAGTAIAAVVQKNHRVNLLLSDNKNEECDLFIAADGVNSKIRAELYPNTHPEYSGYVAFRGTIRVNELELPTTLKTNFHYFVPEDETKGHVIFYPIPAQDYQKTGNVLINWMLYEAYSASELNSLLIDKDNKRQTSSIPKNFLRTEHIKHLHQIAEKFLPPEIVSIITKTKAPFLQVIYDLLIPQFVNERICFLGDAGMTLRPHTGSGAGHALGFAFALANILKTKNEIDWNEILKEWNHGRLDYAKKQLVLSKNMGNALVLRTPSWNKMTQETMDKWWQEIIQGASWHVTDNAKTQKPSHPFFANLNMIQNAQTPRFASRAKL